MIDPNKNYKAELMKLVTEFSKEENWERRGLSEIVWKGSFEPVKTSGDLIKEIITPPPGEKTNNND